MEPIVGRGRIVARIDEVALKGTNRGWFVDVLTRNIRTIVAGLECGVEPRHDRVLVTTRGTTSDVMQRLVSVPGIQRLDIVHAGPPDVDALARTLVDALAETPMPASFAVRVTRKDKTYPLRSPDIERRLGAAIHESLRWPVALRSPDVTVAVEIAPSGTWWSTEQRSGRGGLPVGTSGRVLCLVSGGLDSAVAAWLVMARGCRVALLHCHAQPLTSDASRRLVDAHAGVLARGQGSVRVLHVGVADIQRHLAVVSPPALRTVLLRRAMLRIAALAARHTRAAALVTGEALGQVASQTLENVAAIESASVLPVLRPLITTPKHEIAMLARRAELPMAGLSDADDCCRVFSPARAALATTPAACEAVERHVEWPTLFEAALTGAQRVTLEPDWNAPVGVIQSGTSCRS